MLRRHLDRPEAPGGAPAPAQASAAAIASTIERA
jgi:hypothetical protein